MALGVSVNDFNQIYADFKRTVSYSVVTKTTDPMTGSEISTFATASNKDVIFFKEDRRYLFDVQGLVDVADAYIIAPTTMGVARYDQFTIDGETYYIEQVLRRYVLTVLMQDYCRCFKVA